MSKFFVVCPAYYETGGVELLHQLVYKINLIKEESAVICYEGTVLKTKHPTPKNYFKYTNGIYVTKVEDQQESIVIIPEIFTTMISDYFFARVVVWWLSVDNFFKKTEKINADKKLSYKDYNIGFKYFLYMFLNIFNVKPNIAYNPFTEESLYNNKVILHAYQSEYARHFLENNKLLPILPLSDFLNSTFFHDTIILEEKKDLILYNPAKGFEVTNVLIKEFSQYSWVALENFTPSEMREVMKKSKIYVDFGNHPGKDRIPREAAVNGCVVITNKKGSAYNSKDIAIEEIYKLNTPISSKIEFKALVDNIFSDFENHFNAFQFYREKIKKEEEVFEEELLMFYNKCSQ